MNGSSPGYKKLFLEAVKRRQEAERGQQEAERTSQEEAKRQQEAERISQEEAKRRQEAEHISQREAKRQQEAERTSQEEAKRRQEAENISQREAKRQQEAERTTQEGAGRWQEAERISQEEAKRRQEAERISQEEAKRRPEAERTLSSSAVHLIQVVTAYESTCDIKQEDCVIHISLPDFIAAQYALQKTPHIWSFFSDKLRFDWDPEEGILEIRMAPCLWHECMCRDLVNKVERVITHFQRSKKWHPIIHEIAARIDSRGVGSGPIITPLSPETASMDDTPDIRLDPQKSPDAAWDGFGLPTFIVEIAVSETRAAAEKKVHLYFTRAVSSIRTVVYIFAGDKDSNGIYQSATFTRWRMPAGDEGLMIGPSDAPIRAKDGMAGTGRLRLHLWEFVPEEEQELFSAKLAEAGLDWEDIYRDISLGSLTYAFNKDKERSEIPVDRARKRRGDDILGKRMRESPEAEFVLETDSEDLEQESSEHEVSEQEAPKKKQRQAAPSNSNPLVSTTVATPPLTNLAERRRSSRVIDIKSTANLRQEQYL